MEKDKTKALLKRKLRHFEDCSQAIDQLFRSAISSNGAESFWHFLKSARQLSNLSIFNSMLVMLQRPGAAIIRSRRQWQKMGRNILPDAIPIVILKPFGPVQFLYDIGDTNGRNLTGFDQNPLFAKGKLPDELFEKMKTAAASYGIHVEETLNYGGNMAGTAATLGNYPENLTQQHQHVYRIKLNARHDAPTKYATLAHELGHIYCGHLGAGPGGRWPDRRNLLLSRSARELEAEAVSWLVCQRNGIYTRSADYLHNLIDETSLQSISIYAIYEAANRVESRSDRSWRE